MGQAIYVQNGQLYYRLDIKELNDGVYCVVITVCNLHTLVKTNEIVK
jgi:hypothetical protein